MANSFHARFSDQQIDAAADALRRHEQAGKRLNDWDTLPAATKRKWRDKVLTVANCFSMDFAND